MPDSWNETCFISIAAQSGDDVKFQGITDTIDIDLAEKDIESIALVNGGRVVKYTPQGDTTITFEAYPVEVGTDSGTIGAGFFDLMNTSDASQPLGISLDNEHNKYRVAMMWTDDSSIVEAVEEVDGNNALRIVAADGYFTSIKPSFTDDILKFTVTYKVPAFDKSANANIKFESIDSTGTLAALASYTSSTKW